MIAIGIDPGITGAIAMVNNHGLQGLTDMPTAVRSRGRATVKNQVNGAALADLLKGWVSSLNGDRNEVTVFVELVNSMGGQGVASMFSIGHTCGIIDGVVSVLGYRHMVVTPGEWKLSHGLIVKRPHGSAGLTAAERAARKQAAKAASMDRARSLYPTAELTKVKHHNRAEALLIAHYGYEELA